MKCKMFILTLLSAVLGLSTTPAFAALNLTHLDNYLIAAPERSISMDFKNAQLNDVLKIFSQQSGLNFIAASDIADLQVNLYLDKVPVEDALEHILLANDLTYELDSTSNIFIVKPINMPEVQMITRVYPLKHATVDSSKINETLDDIGESSSSDSSSSDESSSDEAESGILAAIESILSEDGQAIEDPRTNSLIITDLPNRFPFIEHTIARLDVRVPQILIEVEMLDISKNASDFLGAKFGQTPLSFTGGTKSTLFPFDENKLENRSIFPGTAGSAASATETASQYTTSTISFAGLTMALDFLKTQTDTKNLARPRIMTINNETAEIKITTDEVIGTTETQFSESAAEATSEAERSETGVSLIVTPQANLQTGEITMAIQPKVSEAVPSGIDNLKNPEERSVKSILRVNNGDTIVIGGLLRTETTRTNTDVPFISKIPVLGNAFRHKESEEDQRELIVFITPHILKDEFIPQNQRARESIVREHTAPGDKFTQVNKDLSNYQKRF